MRKLEMEFAVAAMSMIMTVSPSFADSSKGLSDTGQCVQKALSQAVDGEFSYGPIEYGDKDEKDGEYTFFAIMSSDEPMQFLDNGEGNDSVTVKLQEVEVSILQDNQGDEYDIDVSWAIAGENTVHSDRHVVVKIADDHVMSGSNVASVQFAMHMDRLLDNYTGLKGDFHKCFGQLYLQGGYSAPVRIAPTGFHHRSPADLIRSL